MSIIMVAAVAKNGVIGKDGDLPWRIPSDLKHFKALTTGKTVIMGRRTFEEVGRPLPNRRNIVVTRSTIDGVETVPTLPAALALAEGPVALIGGHAIYAEGMDHADTIHITRVDGAPDGDTVFPAIDPARFRLVEERPGERTPRDDYGFTFETWRRAG
ncbi:dihydrofolate reductase [Acuticoccus yangtzensis]|uniref:dihydrofolate reductase n=1 Tax=Acuticoccus yangtzensis TaxID=1443441 RepID=UPI000949953A|nr:dihydrofolate reductase [Acuticoccus yangtzensis]ORE95450.1 dihydrofolate reductase [Stappia sp. 22II-S9-Z10]